jgi:hypothetical protein
MNVGESLAEKAAALQGKAKAKKKPDWSRPATIPDGRVLMFDQTFSKTGWCFLTVQKGVLDVVDKGFLQEPPIPDTPKFEDILQRTEWMYDRMCQVMATCRLHTYDFTVGHEAPILHGNRVEASLMGGFACRLACRHVLGKKPRIIENRTMLGLLVPPDERYNQVGKSHIKRALMPYWDVSHGWNEHNRDALALGLTHLLTKDETSP